MNRRQFIESQGATCSSWYWCWSFINEAKRQIIFGAWDNETQGNRTLILSGEWQVNKGRKNPGYLKSLNHTRLIQEEGYRLMTFPMEFSKTKKGKVKIKRIIPVLTEKKLVHSGNDWYAVDFDNHIPVPLAEEVSQPEDFFEGSKTTVTINAYERNPDARAACIKYHGCKCAGCGFDFEKIYGPIGKGFIHVHHNIPIGTIRARYRIDPVKDLTPVCPNCHAMIHRADPALTIKQLRSYLR
jgi:5-methylcytosine-specific restriction protein A